MAQHAPASAPTGDAWHPTPADWRDAADLRDRAIFRAPLNEAARILWRRYQAARSGFDHWPASTTARAHILAATRAQLHLLFDLARGEYGRPQW
jgi:hypothetical protein